MYWTQIVNTDGLFSWCIFRADCHDNSMKEKWEKGIKGLLISPRLLNQIWDLNSGLWVDRSSLLDITWPKFCVSIPHFIVLCRYCILKKLTFVSTLCQASLFGTIFPSAYAHFMSLCHILVIVAVFQTYFYYFICNGDLWLVIFYVTVIIVLGYYEPHSYKTTNLVDKCCLYSVKLFGLSSSFHFFSSPWAPLFPETSGNN